MRDHDGLSMLHLRVPSNSVDMNETVAFHCHRSHSRVISIFFFDCTAAFSPLLPTLKELISKFSFSKMKSRGGSKRLFLTLASKRLCRYLENVNDVNVLAGVESRGNLRGLLNT